MKLRRIGATLAAATLVVTACGGDDDDSGAAEPAAEEPAAEEPAAEEPAAEEPAAEEPAAEEPAAEEPAMEESTAEEPAMEGTAEESAGGEMTPGVSATEMIQQPGECGLGTGEEATGEPIKLGGMATTAEGYVFDWITRMASVYFDCVNANGGIQGRPIEYIWYEEQLDPAQVESLAVKLVEEDQVLGIIGNTSPIECDINGEYYAENGYSAIIAGVSPGCFRDPTWSAVNMGPYYSNLGAAQAVVRMGAQNKLVIVSPDEAGMDFNSSSVCDYAEAEGLDCEVILENTPIADPAGLAQRVVQAAGEGGGVIWNFVPPVVLPVLQAIDEQGLVDSVIWGSSTPPNDNSVAAALSEAWNGKLFINAEFNVLDSGLPDQEHANQLLADSGEEFPMGAFPQMGYLVGRATTEALLSIDGEITKESVNEAIRGLTGIESDMWCKPWYFSSGLDDGNVSNNTDRTVSPQGDIMVQVEDCFDIAALPTNPLGAIREAEANMG
jgi:branched-chain amino acid transport system substrate-binding protein